MTEHQRGDGGDEVTEAMNRVLEAEREAKRSLESATGETAEIIAAARLQRERILSRAERRITRLRKMVAAQLADEIGRLRMTEASTAREPGRGGDEERLRSAVERVALRLSGGADEG